MPDTANTREIVAATLRAAADQIEAAPIATATDWRSILAKIVAAIKFIYPLISPLIEPKPADQPATE